MSKVGVAMTVAMIGSAAVIGYHAYQRALVSPFSIGIVRVGMRFRDTDDDALREMKRRYTCHAVGSGVQVCQLATDGPPGLLRAVVDDSGRVAMIQFLLTDSSPRARALGRRQIQEWNHVSAGDARASDSNSELNLERWQTADSVWSAEMAWRRSADVPGRMTVTGERRLRQIAKSSPATLLRLAEDSLLDSHGLAMAAALTRVANETPEDPLDPRYAP
jgi:hypothetical protein